MPNWTGTAISLHDSDDTRDGNGYIIAGARWAGRGNLAARNLMQGTG